MLTLAAVLGISEFKGRESPPVKGVGGRGLTWHYRRR